MSKGLIPELPILLCLFLAFNLCPAPAAAQQNQDSPPFHVVVVEGEGSINNVRQAVNRGATVMVEDENKNPLSGVAVSFFLPNEGPSGIFPNGSHVLTVFTDEKGVATSRPVHFNNLVGLMRIRVVASLFSQTASAMITQTNVSSAAAVKTGFVPATGVAKVSKPSSGSHKALYILIAVGAAAAAGGIFFATHKSTPSATISTGTPTIGTPTIGGAK